MKIIKIGAIWCPACLVMRKVWKKIENDYKLDILEYDYDIDNDKIGESNLGLYFGIDKLKELIDKYGEL